ncbi:MAG: choice-of-anchor I family protein, partial [Pirellulales bacterium]
MRRSGHFPWIGPLLVLAVTYPAAADPGVALQRLWRHDAGGLGRAEIVAFDAAANELLVVNGTERCVMRLDARSGREVDRLDVSSFGDPTSVAASHGLIAVAVVAPQKTDPGHIVLFRSASGARDVRPPASPLAAVEVGALPDMVTFTPDGRYVLTALEGEPSDDYAVDPPGGIGVIDVSRGAEHATARIADFARFNAVCDSLESQGVRISGPSKSAADGRATVAEDLEPEYIATAPDGLTAWATLQENNAIAVVDVPTAQVKEIIGLDLKDHAQIGRGLDASDRDGGIHIRPRSVWGMYQPDAVAAVSIDGVPYLVTANEGDSRSYGGFTDEVRVEDLKLDPSLHVDEDLKRFKVSSVGGDTDGDGDVDRLLAFGARSLAIWTADGRLVYDSGDALERFIAERMPERFNIDSDGKGTVDDRSDDKGPEPEGVVVGRVGKSTYAFVGLERTSAIAVFDVTHPRSAKLLDIVPLPLEKGPTGGPDIAPEGLCFVPAERSPFGAPLLAVACEVTGTTTLFRVDSVADRRDIIECECHASANNHPRRGRYRQQPHQAGPLRARLRGAWPAGAGRDHRA